jgi:guanylate kinase
MSSNSEQTMPGRLVIISGPSGVGKSTICGKLVERLDNVYLSVSTTTRPIKPGEQNGREYWFVGRDEFERQIIAGNFLEYAQVFGNFYGTPKDKTQAALQQGKIVILEIDVQGAVQVSKLYPDAELIFILPPKHAELEKRMKELQKRINGRHRDDAEDIKKRLTGASVEIAAAWQYYRHMVINDNLDQAVNEIVEIINKSIGE